MAVAELPRGKKGSSETEKNEISSAIEKILTEEKIKGKKVVSSVSGPLVHIQLARLPSLPGEKLREAIEWMVKEKASFDLKETTLDYSMLDKVMDNGAQKSEMIVALAKNKVVQEKMDLLKEAGVKLATVDVVPLALLNSFKVNNEWKKDEIIALVDVEASTTHLAIVKNAKIEFSREIAFGGDTITEGFKERLDLSDARSAQKMRERYGILDEELQSKKAKITSLQPKLDRARTLMRDLNRWNRRYSSIIQLRESSIPWVQILAQFSEVIPEKAWLRELSLGTSPADTSPNKNFSILIIKGSIKWEKLVANLSLMEFISQLEKSLYVNDVSLESADRNTRYGHEMIDFTIGARLLRKEKIPSSTHGSAERIERSQS